jgi:hypothetical protein
VSTLQVVGTISEAEELALRAMERGELPSEAVKPWKRGEADRAEEVLASPADLRRLAGHLAGDSRLAEAEMVARYMVAHHSDDFLALEVAGDIARQQDDCGQALRRYQRAITLEGQPRVARLGIARVLAKMGDTSEEMGLSRPALDFYYRCATLLTAQLTDRADDPWEWYEPWRGPAPLALLNELRQRAERLEEQLRHVTAAVFAVPVPRDDVPAVHKVIGSVYPVNDQIQGTRRDRP